MSNMVHCFDNCGNPSTLLPVPPDPWGGGGTTPPIDPTVVAVTCPTIPSTALAGTTPTIRVLGQNFTAACKIFVDNVELATTMVSATELTCAATSPIAKTSTIQVKNAGVAVPSTCQFTWTAAPLIQITCPLTPAEVVCGSPNTTLVAINGQNFKSTSEILMDGTPVTPPAVYVSATRMNWTPQSLTELTPRTATIGAREGAVVATNTCPFLFTQNILTPTLTSISPDMVGRNDPAELLTITGTNFESGVSVVMRGGLALPTTFVSATQLTVMTDPATATTGLFEMRVKNGVGPTAKLSNPIQGQCVGNPTLGSLVPNTAAAGSAALTCTIYGTNYGDTAVVLVNGNAVPTVRVNSGVLTFDVNPVGAAPASVLNVSVRLGHQHGALHDDITPAAAPLTLPFTFT